MEVRLSDEGARKILPNGLMIRIGDTVLASYWHENDITAKVIGWTETDVCVDYRGGDAAGT